MTEREDKIYSRIGIYGIRNKVNNKIYVGKTGMNFGDRWDSHRALLRNGSHDNQYLQNSWKKYGEENFEFIVIEDCLTEQLNDREIYWIKYYKDLNLAYNISDGGDGGCFLGKHLSDETKRKIGEKNRINMLGRKASEETKKKMSDTRKGRKIGPMSDDLKKKLSESHQRYYEQNPKKLTVDDVKEIRKLHSEGNRYSDIARIFNVSAQCISDICNYKRWKQIA